MIADQSGMGTSNAGGSQEIGMRLISFGTQAHCPARMNRLEKAHGPRSSSQYQPGEGSWSSSQYQPGEGSWSSSSHHQSSHYRPGEGYGSSCSGHKSGEGKKEREEEWDEEQWRDWEDNLPPRRRYLFRSRQSDLNRLERRDLKRRGLEVPPHLRPKPVTQIESQELKKELRELYKRAKEMQQRMQPGEGKSNAYTWEEERPPPRPPSKPRRRSKSRPKPGEGTCKPEPENKEEHAEEKSKKKRKNTSTGSAARDWKASLKLKKRRQLKVQVAPCHQKRSLEKAKKPKRKRLKNAHLLLHHRKNIVNSLEKALCWLVKPRTPTWQERKWTTPVLMISLEKAKIALHLHQWM